VCWGGGATWRATLTNVHNVPVAEEGFFYNSSVPSGLGPLLPASPVFWMTRSSAPSYSFGHATSDRECLQYFITLFMFAAGKCRKGKMELQSLRNPGSTLVVIVALFFRGACRGDDADMQLQVPKMRNLHPLSHLTIKDFRFDSMQSQFQD